MTKTTDIRDQAHLSGQDLLKLNFIKDSSQYVFRKYFRFGLRSHIFEVLLKEDLQKEVDGQIVDGIRIFPRATPQKMFRILRNRFKNSTQVFNEIQKYNVLLKALGSSRIALSEEFIVDYTGTGTSQIILCGLQEYVPGEILDPWRIFDHAYLSNIYAPISPDTDQLSRRVETAYKNIEHFVQKIRNMIHDTGFMPDLAGFGNLILMPDGGFKLVDINNIVKCRLDDTILIDDKGYPSCDVSVKVLSILEKLILQKTISMDDPLYQHFLSPQRRQAVKTLERKFQQTL